MIADFTSMLDTWHSSPEVYDNELDAQIHRWYADCINHPLRHVWPPKGMPYFTPSSVNSCQRGLYEKMKGAKRDQLSIQPHQGRWTRIGTAISDAIQRDLLYIEKHYQRVTRQAPRFIFERNEKGEPMFEDFAKKMTAFTDKGKPFAFLGTCDGMMHYRTRDGGSVRVGLEIKSKQTTSARTSLYSLRGPESSHMKQCIAYAIMYGVEHYIILYVNAAKVGWAMEGNQYEKTPDIRAFHLYISERDKQTLLEECADLIQAVEEGNPPSLDTSKWLFNNYKTAVAMSLTEKEVEELKQLRTRIFRSTLPMAKKRDYDRCYEDVIRIRQQAVSHD